MRETRQSGSEGGARFNPLSLPLSRFMALMRIQYWRSELSTEQCTALQWQAGSPGAVPSRVSGNNSHRQRNNHR